MGRCLELVGLETRREEVEVGQGGSLALFQQPDAQLWRQLLVELAASFMVCSAAEGARQRTR